MLGGRVLDGQVPDRERFPAVPGPHRALSAEQLELDHLAGGRQLLRGGDPSEPLMASIVASSSARLRHSSVTQIAAGLAASWLTR